MTGGKPCNLCISLNCASIFCKWRMRSECADFDQNAPGYFSFVSVYSTCLRTSGLGSNFISFNLSGLMRLFFCVVLEWPLPALDSSLIFSRLPFAMHDSSDFAARAQTGQYSIGAFLVNQTECSI